MIKKILHISPDFNYACGVSKYVFMLLKHFSIKDDYKIYFITNGGDALSKLNGINVETNIIKFSRGMKNIFNFRDNYNYLTKFCKEKEIKVIHTHHRYPEYLSYLLSRKTDIRTITTVHSFVKGLRPISFKSDKIIAVSNAVKNYIIKEFKIPVEKIIILHNCCPPLQNENEINNDELKRKLNIPARNKIILFAGRFSKIKGLDILIKAFLDVKKKFSEVSLLLVGKSYDSMGIKLLKKYSGTFNVIDPIEQINVYYQLCDLVVLPAREDPFPFVMLEAGLMKKPFIGSRVGGIAEFIENGIDGLLFEPGNKKELMEQILYVLNHPEDSQKLGENLNKKVLLKNSCSEYFNQINKIYCDLLK